MPPYAVYGVKYIGPVYPAHRVEHAACCSAVPCYASGQPPIAQSRVRLLAAACVRVLAVRAQVCRHQVWARVPTSMLEYGLRCCIHTLVLYIVYTLTPLVLLWCVVRGCRPRMGSDASIPRDRTWCRGKMVLRVACFVIGGPTKIIIYRRLPWRKILR